MSHEANPTSVLRDSLRALYPPFRQVIFFSLFTNLLMLSSTAYMLEVYDRVVNSRNQKTLWMLTLLVLFAYAVMEVLEWVRTDILQRGSQRWDEAINRPLFEGVFYGKLKGSQGVSQALSDLRVVRDFLASSALLALFDTPLALLIMVLIFLINPLLGWVSLGVAILQVGVAFATEKGTRLPLREAQTLASQTQHFSNNSLRYAEVIEAMGMLSAFRQRWSALQHKFVARQADASNWAGGSVAAAKFVQLFQGSALLGIGVWLSISGAPMSGGMMIVASVLGSRAITPFVQVISQWRQIVTAQEAYGRIDKLLKAYIPPPERMPLPTPVGALSLEAVMASAPGTALPIIRGISLGIPVGTTVVMIGASASGKSSLGKLMVGVWPPSSGKVRLDGNDIHAWSKAELGPYIGYLPQEVELFDGTLAENIARFGEVDRDQVEVASMAVGLHAMILALPDGYDSEIGDEGCFLSGGMRQRVGLARAIYGQPKLVVLDEPNSSLDEAGELALVQTMQTLKALGTTIVLITHRPSILQVADRILAIHNGMVHAYGPRDEVLAALNNPAPGPAAPAKAGGAAA